MNADNMDSNSSTDDIGSDDLSYDSHHDGNIQEEFNENYIFTSGEVPMEDSIGFDCEHDEESITIKCSKNDVCKMYVNIVK
jgi:hypothetical protein